MTSYPLATLRLCVLAALTVSCGGVTYVTDECSGPYCDVVCQTNADCPAEARCSVGKCSTGTTTGGGDDVVGGDDDGIGGDGDPTGGDGADGDGTGGDGADNDGVGGDGADDDGVGGDGADGDGTGGDDDGVGPCVPGAPEVCNYRDDNCDTQIDEGVLNGCGNCDPFPLCNTTTPWVGDGGADAGDLPLSTTDGTITSDGGTVLEDVDSNGFGSVTLGTGNVATDFAWPASESHGTISRIDTILKKEVGRYATVLVLPNDPRKPYVSDYDHTPDTAPQTACQEPSRSTVDEFGNAYIANRAASGYSGKCESEDSAPQALGSVSKIAYYNDTLCNHAINPSLEGCQCVDRDGNGFIQTSRDYNGDANSDGQTIEVSTCPGSCSESAFAAVKFQVAGQPAGTRCTGSKCATECEDDAACGVGFHCVFVPEATTPNKQRCSDKPNLPEFLGKNDECLVWTRRIQGGNEGTDGPTRSTPRGMAIDKQGYIWVGAYETNRLWKLRSDGEFVYPVDPDGTGPLQVNDVCARTLRRVSTRAVVSVLTNGTTESASTAYCLTNPCYETLPSSCRIDGLVGAYGAVIDSGRKHAERFGYMWITDTDGNVTRTDTQTGLVAQAPTQGNAYGISIDHKDRVWTADSGEDALPEVHRLTPDACVGGGCGTACTQDSQCGAAKCLYGHCSTAMGTWATYRPSRCVGAWCTWCDSNGDGTADTNGNCADSACNSDTECSTAASGNRKCTSDADTQNRGCTRQCSNNSECSPFWGSSCSGGVCIWDTTDTWRGRGITTELIGDADACAEQGAPGVPCARVWAIFHNTDWNAGANNPPNYTFAFDADTGREIVSARRRLDRDPDSSSDTTVNGNDNMCSGPVGVGLGVGGTVWAVNHEDDSICVYDPLAPDDPVGSIKIDVNPYTYSDFTGNLFRSFTNPQGKYQIFVDACPFPNELDGWIAVRWNATVNGSSKLELRLRFGNSIGEARNPLKPQVGPVQSVTGANEYLIAPLTAGEYAEVEFKLIADDAGNRPSLHQVEVVRTCKVSGGG